LATFGPTLLANGVYPTLAAYLLCAASMLCAQAVYMGLGFGAGLVAIGSLALVLTRTADAVVLLILTSLPLELYVVWRTRRHVAWAGVLRIAVGLAIGLPLGAYLLRAGAPQALLRLLGLMLVLVGVVFAVLPSRVTLSWPSWAAVPVGGLAGLLGGLWGVGGPPLVLYYRLSGTEKQTFRGCLIAIQLLMSLGRVPLYALNGLLTANRGVAALYLLPPVVLGALAGSLAHQRLSQGTYERAISVFIALLGVALMLR